MSERKILEAISEAGYLTFAAALQTSGYGEMLNGAGPFTVFAPNDAAFEKFVLAGHSRLLEGDRELMESVIGYHFAVGKVMSARFAGKRIRAAMHSGGDVIINGAARLRVNGAHIVEPDIQASNGVIHGIDAVLWPREAAITAGAA